MPDPQVSVIVPVHNGARFLPEAVASIREQAPLPMEIIVVDDGSTDGLEAIAVSLGDGLRYLARPRGGPAAARNTGLDTARGELIAFLDVDDLWPSGKLTVQASYLVEHPDVDVVLGRILSVEGPGSVGGAGATDAVIGVNLGSGLFRRRVFDRVGRFDESLTYSEDHDWFFRAREEGVVIVVLDEIGLYYRRHAGNMTAAPDARGYQLARVVRRSLERRRSRQGGPVRTLPAISELGSPPSPEGGSGPAA